MPNDTTEEKSGNGCAWALAALFALFGLGVLALLLLPIIAPQALRLIPR